MAAKLVSENPTRFEALVLMASYPPDSASLAASDIPVLSISAQFDGPATAQKIEDRKHLLPADTSYREIPGGNHAGFGNYGPQKGDGNATIPAAEQWRFVASKIMSFVSNIDN